MNSVPFTGLLSKQALSEDHIKKLSQRIEEVRKTSMQVVEYFNLVNRGVDQYNGNTTKQIEGLESFVNADMNEDKRYYQLLCMAFKTISINFNNFCTGLEASLKEYHIATSVQLDELSTAYYDNAISVFKYYRTKEDSLQESHKKYTKLQRTFQDSLTAYKNIQAEANLVYNKEETLKRYQLCESGLQNILTEERNIQERSVKCTKAKREAIYAFNMLGAEFKTAYLFIGEKVILEAKNVMTIFCSLHKYLIGDLATKKRAIESTRIGTFLDVPPEFNDSSRFFKTYEKRLSKYPIFLEQSSMIKDEYLPCFGRWLNDYHSYLQNKSQTNFKVLKKTYHFLLDQAKGFEKMSNFMVKDVPQSYNNLKKKLQDTLGTKSLELTRCVNCALEMGMRIYEKLTKTLATRLQQLQKYINEQGKLFEMFFKEMTKQIEQLNSKKGFNEQTIFEILSEDMKTEIRSLVKQKSQIIKHFLTSFGEKFTKNSESIKSELGTIINQMFTSFNEIYVYANEYQCTYFGDEFADGLTKTINDINQILDREKPGQPVSADLASQEVSLVASEKFNTDEFKTVRKPSNADQIEIVKTEIEKEVDLKNSYIKRSTLQEQKIKETGQMDAKQKKYFDFLKKKVTLEEGETLLKTYSCALSDKIILQGKLYITASRVCFHSYFNAANVFFGNTFLHIPKKDIVKIQKRFNAKIFDNSLAFTTINGEVFFTSFFKRDEAYRMLTGLYGLPCDEDEDVIEEGEAKNNGEDQTSNDASTVKETPKEETKQVKESNKGSNIQSAVSEPKQTPIKQLVEPTPLAESKIMSNHIGEADQFKRSSSYRAVEQRKIKKVYEKVIPEINCLLLLKKFKIDIEVISGGKKYPGYYQIYKELIVGSKDVKMQKWNEPIENYLTENNITVDMPTSFSRVVDSIHPLPKTSVPFMPKTCQSHEDITLYIISKNKFIEDSIVSNKGAPYTDSFRVHSRMKFEDLPDKGVKVQVYFQVQFLKSVMIKAMIESQSQKQFTEAVERQVKFYAEKGLIEHQKELKRLEKAEHIKRENSSIKELPLVAQDESPVASLQVSPAKQEPTSSVVEVKPQSHEQVKPVAEQAAPGQEGLEKQNKMLKLLLAISVLLNIILLLF